MPLVGSALHAIPDVQRRQAPGVYRALQNTGGAVSYASKRVLGLWVPAEAFRRGTLIRFTGHSATNSPIFRLSVGGDGRTANAGVSFSFTTGPAAACGFDLRMIQRLDKLANVTLDSSGFFSGATSLVVTAATASVHIQPLTYVEINTNGTFTLGGCILEVIVPQWNSLHYQGTLDV